MIIVFFVILLFVAALLVAMKSLRGSRTPLLPWLGQAPPIYTRCSMWYRVQQMVQHAGCKVEVLAAWSRYKVHLG